MNILFLLNKYKKSKTIFEIIIRGYINPINAKTVEKEGGII